MKLVLCHGSKKKKSVKSNGKPHLWWTLKWNRNPVKKNKYLFHSTVKKKINSESYSGVTVTEVHRLLAIDRLGATCPGCLADFVTRGYQRGPLWGCTRNLWLASWNVACLTRIIEGESLYGIRLGYGELMVLAGQECVIKGWPSVFKNGTRVDRHEHALTRGHFGPRCCLRRKVN